MILKMKSIKKRPRGNVFYFTVKEGRVYRRTPRAKYTLSAFITLDRARRVMEKNGYKEIKPIKKLTEIEWLDKVCENFKDDGLDNGF
jgi:hypothetical protein